VENEILKIAKRIQAISQTGIRFTNDNFDKERYEELRELSVKLASITSDTKLEKIRELFTNETGFQTPKIDIRAVILDKGKLLLTKEKSDKKWSLPGGYADVNFSPREIAEKEVLEETGLIVQAKKVLAIIDTNQHNFPPLEYHFYKIIFLCEKIGGELKGSNETEISRFFHFDEIPELSLKRNTNELIDLIKNKLNNNETYFD
jgi:ADP-ribose pyrophosphatase YjhB (NUDIX family)